MNNGQREQERDEARRRRIRAQVERLITAMREDGIAGATIGPDGAITGVPNWEEATRHQRMSEKAKTHGYPPGLAKSTRWPRDALLAAERERLERSSPEERAARDAAHEALAWALDAEHFLGAFSRGAPGAFPAEAVDEVAGHLLLWLRERGFRVVPVEE